jgi:hypothetical protein
VRNQFSNRLFGLYTLSPLDNQSVRRVAKLFCEYEPLIQNYVVGGQTHLALQIHTCVSDQEMTVPSLKHASNILFQLHQHTEQSLVINFRIRDNKGLLQVASRARQEETDVQYKNVISLGMQLTKSTFIRKTFNSILNLIIGSTEVLPMSDFSHPLQKNVVSHPSHSSLYVTCS